MKKFVVIETGNNLSTLMKIIRYPFAIRYRGMLQLNVTNLF